MDLINHPRANEIHNLTPIDKWNILDLIPIKLGFSGEILIIEDRQSDEIIYKFENGLLKSVIMMDRSIQLDRRHEI